MNDITVEKTFEERPCIVCKGSENVLGVKFYDGRVGTEIALCGSCRKRMVFLLGRFDRQCCGPWLVTDEKGFYGDCPSCGLRIEHSWQEGQETKFCKYCGERISWK